MRVLRKLIVPFAFLVSILALAPPASAAPGATLGEPTRDGCNVSVPFTFEDAGTYTFKVWDEGEMIDEQSYDAAEGETHAFIWTIVSDVSAGNPGVALNIYDAGGNLLDTDNNWDFPGSGEIAKACADAADDPKWTITTPSTVTTTTAPQPPTTVTVPGTPSGPTTTVPSVDPEPTTPETMPTTPPASNGGGVSPASGARPISGSPNFTG